MPTIDLSLSDDLTAFVEAEPTREGHPSAGDYLVALVREAQQRIAKKRLRAKLREATESGPATSMTCEDWDLIESEAMSRLAEERTRA